MLKTSWNRIRNLKPATKAPEKKPSQTHIAEIPKSSVVVFWLSVVCLFGLFIYFGIYYSSVAHMSFFYNPVEKFLNSEEDIDDLSFLFNSVFSPTALSDALKQQPPNLFVLFFPVIFYSLALCVEMSIIKRYWVVLGVILIATFCFDSLLAYQIAEKFHHIGVIMGKYEGTWNLRTALTSPNFLSLLCSGFLVFIAFSLLFSFSVDQGSRLNPHKTRTKVLREQWNHLHTERDAVLAQMDQIQNQIHKLRAKTRTRGVDLEDFRRRGREFLDGWYRFNSEDVWYKYPKPDQGEQRQNALKQRNSASEDVFNDVESEISSKVLPLNQEV